ncbi:hypothetical protein EYF80_017435 [Liparis tanakae]|uniref:Uncharacterized protein n=1 Tax=Liparis tanakae TaxID=230148 RepID=A0A4Z2I4X3_9TELE|nr:hypothetical protein EYF80_017435 [Liparis tanakae]
MPTQRNTDGDEKRLIRPNNAQIHTDVSCGELRGNRGRWEQSCHHKHRAVTSPFTKWEHAPCPALSVQEQVIWENGKMSERIISSVNAVFHAAAAPHNEHRRVQGHDGH